MTFGKLTEDISKQILEQIKQSENLNKALIKTSKAKLNDAKYKLLA